MRETIALLVFLLIIAAPVAAISVTPSSTNLNPSDTYPKTFEFNLVNTDGSDIGISLSISGNLKDYITVTSFDETIAPGHSGKVVFSVDLPKDIAPGSYRSEITATAGQAAATSGAGVNIAISHVVWFDLAYPGKHLSPKVQMMHHPDGMLYAVAYGINDGTEDVTGAKIDVTIFSPNGEKLADASGSGDIPVNTSDAVTANVSVKSPVAGEYRAKMTLEYDGQTVSKEETITLSEQGGQATAQQTGGAATIISPQQAGGEIMYPLVLAVLALTAYIIFTRRKGRTARKG